MESTGPPYDKWDSKLGANACNQADQKAKDTVDSLLCGNQNKRVPDDDKLNKNCSIPPNHTDCSNFR
ncbi:unnamed protein product [Caenorhabditis brenneri]